MGTLNTIKYVKHACSETAFHRSAVLIKNECLSAYASMRIGFAILVWRFTVLLLLHCLVWGDEEGLFLLRDCRRDISSHLKTYGLSKCSEDICNEVDLLLSHGGELSIFFFSSGNNQLMTGCLDERSHDICQTHLLTHRTAKLVFCVIRYG